MQIIPLEKPFSIYYYIFRNWNNYKNESIHNSKLPVINICLILQTDKPIDTSDPDLELYYQGPEPELHLTSTPTPVQAIDSDPAKWVSGKEFFVPARQAYTSPNQVGVSEVKAFLNVFFNIHCYTVFNLQAFIKINKTRNNYCFLWLSIHT